MSTDISYPIGSAQPASTTRLVSQGWGIRAGARIIDTIILVAAGSVAGLIVGTIIGVMVVTSGADINDIQQRVSTPSVLTYFIGFLATLLYFSICEAFHGSTPGKIMLGLVVVNEDGTPAGFGAAIKRNLGYFVDAILIGLVAYLSMKDSPLKQRVGDKWAKTVVPKRSEVRPENLRSVGEFFLVATGAVIVATVLNLLPTLLALI